MVKTGRAVVATKTFALRGSVAEGQAMMAYIVSLTLRAITGMRCEG